MLQHLPVRIKSIQLNESKVLIIKHLQMYE